MSAFTMRTVLALAVCAAGVTSQDLVHKAAPQKKGIVLTGAAIYPVSSEPIESGWIHFVDGRIHGIGEGEAPALPDNPTPIDITGKRVYPGMISAVTTVGLVEISQVPATRDESEAGNLTPEVRAAVAFNPDSTVIPVTRSAGVLTVGVFPTGGSIPGRAGVMRLEGWTWEDMSLDSDAGMVISWPSGQRGDSAREARREIADAFAAARSYVAGKERDKTIPTDLRWEAMRSVLAGDKPVFVRADDLEQIESAVVWAQREGVRMVLVGGRDAPLCAELLTTAGVPIIVRGTHRLPARRDAAYSDPFTLPMRLEAAGLEWCLASDGNFYNERNLPYHAATAVAFGLAPEVALRSITESAAAILGVGDQIGSLEVGKAATLIVTDGDPLLFTTTVEQAFVDGRLSDLNNKQEELAEKYREKYRELGLWPN